MNAVREGDGRDRACGSKASRRHHRRRDSRAHGRRRLGRTFETISELRVGLREQTHRRGWIRELRGGLGTGPQAGRTWRSDSGFQPYTWSEALISRAGGENILYLLHRLLHTLVTIAETCGRCEFGDIKGCGGYHLLLLLQLLRLLLETREASSGRRCCYATSCRLCRAEKTTASWRTRARSRLRRAKKSTPGRVRCWRASPNSALLPPHPLKCRTTGYERTRVTV